MIEVLLGNDLVNTINKTKKKISIKHYLNTYLFPVGENYEGEPLYPLYYRVIFNKQSVKIKSSIDKAFSVREFEEGKFSDMNHSLDNDNFYWDLMTREALSLTHVISDFFEFSLIAAEREINPNIHPENLSEDENKRFQEEAISNVIQNFDINLLFKHFNFSDYELSSVIEDRLFDAIYLFSETHGLKFDFETFGLHKHKLNAFQYIQFLKETDSVWKEFEKCFPNSIWFFNMYYFHFVSHSRSYRKLGATIVDLLYLDFEKQLDDSTAGRKIKETLFEIKQLANTPRLFLV